MSSVADSVSNTTNNPLIVIEPGRGYGLLNLGEIWRYRELLYFLAWRDVKIRYKQTVFGVTWVLLQPLLMTAVFTVFLGMLARVPSKVPYPLVVLTGLLPWTFVSSAVIGCGQSLVSNATLVTKVYFPRVLVPIAHVISRLMDSAILLVIVVLLLWFYRNALQAPVGLGWALITVTLAIMVTVLLTLGVGILVACLNVLYRDIGVALPLIIQIWMFVSPIVYPLGLVPERWRLVYYLNPLVGIVQAFRAAFLGEHLPPVAAISTAISTVLVLLVASYVFRRTERSLADFV